MSIPKYDEMYRAFLDCLADGQAHQSKEVKAIVASIFDISATEREEVLPSGKQPLLDNRIGWTRTYLKKARLVQICWRCYNSNHEKFHRIGIAAI